MPGVTAAPTALVARELAAVDELFARELTSDLSNVNQLITHVAKFRGKMLRPMLVLLSGLAAGGFGEQPVRLANEHVTLATVVEMVHIATLVHDDILDGAEVRRRGATINHLHGNEAAVLLGDYLISHAYHLCSALDSQQYARLIAHTTNVVCEGELTQNFNRRNWKLDEKTYLQIIYRKTASLTEACCRLGALASLDKYTSEKPPALPGECAGGGANSAFDPPAEPGAFASRPAAEPEALHRGACAVEALALYGKQLGMAFQIIDDVLDICGQQKTVGKSLGTDIEKGKLTLPMIHFLKHAAPQHRELLVGLLESHEHDRVERVRQLLAPSDSMDYARAYAEGLVEEAIRAVRGLPAGEARDVLIDMAHYVTARDR